MIFMAERGRSCSCHCDKLAIRYQQLQIAECDDDDDPLHAVSVNQPSQSWLRWKFYLLQWKGFQLTGVWRYRNKIQYNTIRR